MFWREGDNWSRITAEIHYSQPAVNTELTRPLRRFRKLRITKSWFWTQTGSYVLTQWGKYLEWDVFGEGVEYCLIIMECGPHSWHCSALSHCVHTHSRALIRWDWAPAWFRLTDPHSFTIRQSSVSKTDQSDHTCCYLYKFTEGCKQGITFSYTVMTTLIEN